MPIYNEVEGTPHDIDAVIAAVRTAMPEVYIVQMHQTHPCDDDGLWWFRLPGLSRDMQIESSTYDCPFIVEHSGMMSSSEALSAYSVEEAVSMAISYLRSISGGNMSGLGS